MRAELRDREGLPEKLGESELLGELERELLPEGEREALEQAEAEAQGEGEVLSPPEAEEEGHAEGEVLSTTLLLTDWLRLGEAEGDAAPELEAEALALRVPGLLLKVGVMLALGEREELAVPPLGVVVLRKEGLVEKEGESEGVDVEVPAREDDQEVEKELARDGETDWEGVLLGVEEEEAVRDCEKREEGETLWLGETLMLKEVVNEGEVLTLAVPEDVREGEIVAFGDWDEELCKERVKGAVVGIAVKDTVIVTESVI